MYPTRLAKAAVRTLLRSPVRVARARSHKPVVSDRGAELDRDCQALLKVVGTPWLSPERGSIVRARRLMDLATTAYAGPDVSGISVDKREIVGADGVAIPVRIFRPKGLPQRLPVVVYYHGGGFAVGNSRIYTRFCGLLASRARVVVVSVDYRLAPEHPFPAAVDDSVAVFEWVQIHAAQFGGDTRRVAVAGDSAGGNLAAVVSLVARDSGKRPPCAQLLIYPVVDQTGQELSRISLGKGFLLSQSMIEFFCRCYIPEGVDRRQPRLSPLFAEHHRNLPPALVITAGFDPLRDEGERYHRVLSEAGNHAKLLAFDRLIHGFICFDGVVKAAAVANEAIVDGFAELLAQTSIRMPAAVAPA